MSHKFRGDVQVEADLILSNSTANRALTTDGSSHIEVSTTTAAELAFLSGTTSSVQDQLDDKIDSGTASIVNADISPTAAIDATKIADGTVTSAEFQFINSLTSNVQTQLDNKASVTLNNLTTTAFNADLVPDTAYARLVGSSTLPISILNTKFVRAPGNFATFTATATAGSAVLTSVSSFTNIFVDTVIYGPGIAMGNFIAITAFDSGAGTITLNTAMPAGFTTGSYTYYGVMQMSVRPDNATGSNVSGDFTLRGGDVGNAGRSGALAMRTGDTATGGAAIVSVTGDTTGGNATISNIADTSAIAIGMRIGSNNFTTPSFVLSKTANTVTLNNTAFGTTTGAIYNFSDVFSGGWSVRSGNAATGFSGFSVVQTGTANASNGVSGPLTLRSGTATGTNGISGNVNLSSGAVASGTSGAIFSQTGAATTGISGFGRYVTGSVTTGTSGQLDFATGNATSTGISGQIIVSTGSTNDGDSGDVFVFTGSAATSGDTGGISMQTGDSNTGASGGASLASGNVTGGTGDSGDVTLASGTSSGGNRGVVRLNAGGYHILNMDDTTLQLFKTDLSSNIAFQVPSGAFTSTTYTLPEDGTVGQVLRTNGAGVLTWITPSGGGATTELDNLTTTAINADLIPDTDNTLNLGTTGTRWSSLFVTSLKDGSGNVSVDVQNRTLYNAALDPKLAWGSDDVTITSANSGDIILDAEEIQLNAGATGVSINGDPLYQDVTGDIPETSFAAANNQASPVNVTGLAFANGVTRSFTALVSVSIDATADLYEVFELRGVQRAADWALAVVSTGDDSNVDFTITTAGQVQYTSGNEAGFVSSTIKFRAMTTSV